MNLNRSNDHDDQAISLARHRSALVMGWLIVDVSYQPQPFTTESIHE